MIKANLTLTLAKTFDFSESENPKLTIFFIHGIATDSSSFKHTLSFLTKQKSLKNLRFIAFDLLGTGKSLKSDGLEYNFDEQISAFKNSIEKLNLKTPLLLVGHSMGTLLITRFANLYPKNIKELIILSIDANGKIYYQEKGKEYKLSPYISIGSSESSGFTPFADLLAKCYA